MNATETEERREFKKTIVSEKAKNVRLEKKVDDYIRELNRVKAVIHDLEEDKRRDQSKITVLMNQINDIDRENLT